MTKCKKIAVVTGSALRIGRGIAEHLLENGYFLILHAHTSIDTLKDWVSKHPLSAQVIAMIEADLSMEDGQEHFCRRIKEQTEHIDLLVHNASLYKPESFARITRQSYREMLGINLDAPYFITQMLLSCLEKSANPSVVSIIDALWERPRVSYSHYTVAKAGLAMLTKGLARELAPHIRINAVSPGLILFQASYPEKERSVIVEKIPLKQLGDVFDIAKAVLFLAESSYITGEILNVDGGRSLV